MRSEWMVASARSGAQSIAARAKRVAGGRGRADMGGARGVGGARIRVRNGGSPAW